MTSTPASTGVRLTIHRAATEIGGNCIEISCDGHRLILDAGSPLDGGGLQGAHEEVPGTLDQSAPVDALVLSHPHLDHFGLLPGLPPTWPVWSGRAAETLMRITAATAGRAIAQQFQTYEHRRPFRVGPFTVTPFLTDHSAFDAYMLLVECGGKRILYSGDFRRTGRKAVLVDAFMRDPPSSVDVLLMEGTTLGRAGGFPTEANVEDDFVALFGRTPGRVFVTWSAQNIDRTVSIYRACKRAGRTLVLDLYTIDVLERLSALRDSVPRLGWPLIRPVITAGMRRMYADPKRMNAPGFVERIANSANALGAAKLAALPDSVVMLRPSLWKDFRRKGLEIGAQDAWVFSMWQGCLANAEYQDIRQVFETHGAACTSIHTSGHASPEDLLTFAERVKPRYLVPIHSANWDAHVGQFPDVHRLKNGEEWKVA